jgi:soluble lytic murein transglycosylase
MPETGAMIADELDYEPFQTDDLLNPEINLRFGSFYLDKMLAQFGQLEYALAAYNAGPHRVTKWLSGLDHAPLDEFVEMIPFSETRKYTKRVLASHWNYTRIYSSSSTLPSNQSNE